MRSILPFLLALVPIVAAEASPIHRDVFIFAGQSNCDGRGMISELVGPLAIYAGLQSNVLTYYTNPAYGVTSDPLYQKWVPLRPGMAISPGSKGPLPRSTFGMEISAGNILSQHFAHPAIIKVTRGGTALGHKKFDWYPAPLDSPDVGPLYTALIKSTRQALQKLTASGDTYTVHALFWHQGESDAKREASYGQMLTAFIASVRRDLNLPNLRVVIGELAPAKPQSFRDIQWQVSRDVPNASFVSSKNLITRDENTHFNTASMIRYGQRLGKMLTESGRVIDFETPAYTTGSLDRQNDFSVDPAITVQATAASGEYPAGQAVGDLTTAEDHCGDRHRFIPLRDSREMKADFYPKFSDSTLLVAGWSADTNLNKRFDPDETGIGMGLSSDGLFQLRIGNTVHPSTRFPYQASHWYRLIASWTAVDASAASEISLHVRDMTTAKNLNDGSPILTTALSNLDPTHWLGLGLCVNRGLIDNLGTSPSPLKTEN